MPLAIGIKPTVMIKRNNVFGGIPPGIVSPTVEDAERKMAKLVWLGWFWLISIIGPPFCPWMSETEPNRGEGFLGRGYFQGGAL